MCQLQASQMFLWQYFFMLVVMKVKFLLLFDQNWCVSIYTSRSLDADILQFWGVDGWNFSPNACIAGECFKCSSSVRSKICWICWKCPCSSYIHWLALSPVLTLGFISCGNLEFLHTYIFVGMWWVTCYRTTLDTFQSRWMIWIEFINSPLSLPGDYVKIEILHRNLQELLWVHMPWWRTLVSLLLSIHAYLS